MLPSKYAKLKFQNFEVSVKDITSHVECLIPIVNIFTNEKAGYKVYRVSFYHLKF